jgi:MarR family transcriptional regulator, 2-MHQ and catechol-resistance regulon repressor
MKQQLSTQAKQLHQALTHLVQQYQFRDRNDICCYGISVSQCHTLEALGEHGTQTMHDLAEHLHLAVSTVTRVVDQLVDKGLAERHSGITDRRVCEVVLTPRGRELLGTIQGELIAREQAVLERIPAASRAHVIWAIEALSQAIDEWRKTVAQDGEGGCHSGL